MAVCDKSPLILAGLDKLLTDDRRFNLVLKVTDGEEFLDAARAPRFTLAVIGWQLPTLHARDVLRALSRQASAPKIVVYSGTNDPAAPAETLQLGGAGFVSKRAPPERLLDVLSAVAAGNMVFPFVDIRKMRADPLENLTLRERSLLSALGQARPIINSPRNSACQSTRSNSICAICSKSSKCAIAPRRSRCFSK